MDRLPGNIQVKYDEKLTHGYKVLTKNHNVTFHINQLLRLLASPKTDHDESICVVLTL